MHGFRIDLPTQSCEQDGKIFDWVFILVTIWHVVRVNQIRSLETSFLDLNVKVIGNNTHTSVYDKRDDFGFLIVNFPWLSGVIPRLPSYGIYISKFNLVCFARCCSNVSDFHFKNLQIASKLLTQGYRYHKLRKKFGKFFSSYSEPLSKVGTVSFQEFNSKGITHPVFYGELFYKLMRVKDTAANFIL